MSNGGNFLAGAFLGASLESLSNSSNRRVTSVNNYYSSSNERKTDRDYLPKHLIKDWIDESKHYVIDPSDGTKLYPDLITLFKRERSKEVRDIPNMPDFNAVSYAGKTLCLISEPIQLKPIHFKIPCLKQNGNDHKEKANMLLKSSDVPSLEPDLQRLQEFFTFTLEKIRADYEKTTYTHTEYETKMEQVVKKNFFKNTIENVSTQVPVYKTRYNKLDGIKLQQLSWLNLTFIQKFLSSQDEEINVSIPGKSSKIQSLEDFVANLVKTDRYRLSIVVDRFTHWIRDNTLYGKIQLKVVCIRKVVPDEAPPAYD